MSDHTVSPRAGLPAQGRVGFAIGIASLALQVFWVIGCQFGPSRHFCWAPHTTQTAYTLEVWVEGQPLSDEQIFDRYHMNAEGWEVHSYQNMIDMLIAYQQTEGADESDTRIRLTYRINNAVPRLWTWSSDDQD